MRFEYDARKSESNLEKHGIDFDEAQELWRDRNMIATSVRKGGEERFVGLARYAGCCWVVVYAARGESVRIVSVRRATAKEASVYDKANR
ncbi:BrnT family toxin [uncultured Adlercreutzia sp.]|uniref:BrnT family toxin n=1 Tax=uncultured Adlercreutzia sp. TaxID=875803 RepID=UPI0026761F19|nr:BrnT family toxin [uncultured Adlercreutzia sp.]